jgi:hypothetical protein
VPQASDSGRAWTSPSPCGLARRQAIESQLSGCLPPPPRPSRLGRGWAMWIKVRAIILSGSKTSHPCGARVNHMPGSSVNSPRVSLCCHGNITHTECAAHVIPGHRTLEDAGLLGGAAAPLPPFIRCLLITVQPSALGDVPDEYSPGSPSDSVVDCGALRVAVGRSGVGRWAEGGALAIRTLPNSQEKLRGDWGLAWTEAPMH